MDAKEIKACLKTAREAIRNKDFKEALKQCKTVLAVDKSNYNALVFIGVAAEGLDQLDQALKAYRKATVECPDQLLAWQGLSNMLDKNPTLVAADEAATIFEKLMSLNTTDPTKQVLFMHKLAVLYAENKEIDKAVDTLTKILEQEKDSDKRKKTQQFLISLLVPSAPKLEESKLTLYKDTLQQLLESSLTPEETNEYTRQLLVLTSQLEVDNIKNVCLELRNKFATAEAPVEFLLHYHLDQNIGNGIPTKDTSDTIEELIAQLTQLKGDHPLIKIGQGFLALQDKKFIQAQECLQGVDTECISGWYYLGQIYLNLHSYQHCIDTCEQGLATCRSAKRILCASTANVVAFFKLAQAEAYRNIRTAEAQDSAMALLEEIEERMPNNVFLIKAYVFLDQGKIEESQTCASCLSADVTPVQTLKSAILFEKKAFLEAYKFLQEITITDPLDAQAVLLLGKTLWELRNNKEVEAAQQECFTTLLKAAKLDPYNHESFLYLGYFYKEIQKDLTKARRCFQKAYDLCPGGEKQGCALVDTLVELGEESQSLRILETVTSEAAAGGAKWAWLRLGLYQIKHENPTIAITSLQSALRADPNDNHVWECLAEAYLQRGSLTASLKAFTKASELDPDSLYCQYQIASIKHTLGSLSEAIQEYKLILEKSPNYVPVLKGVGETLIQLGKLNLSRCLDGIAQDNFEEAIGHLTRAASQRPDLSCLWKLMGDACTMIHPLASNSYSIPSKLVNKSSQEPNLKRVSKIELLQVGSRCFSQALKILPESGALWHDLAVNLYYQSQQMTEEAERSAVVQRATQAIKKSISLEPKDWRHWNVLGVIAINKVNHKPALAQHCFIKSIECEANNVVAWTNLGTLYISKGDIKLAHDAFKAAQSVDPTYTACWIGQALIAEIVGPDEAMDLFRHTTELGYQPESAIGYGQWVLSILGDGSKNDTELFEYCIRQVAAIPAASDALLRYTGRIPTDPIAYNMLGLLYEHQSLYQSAVAALEKALLLLEQNGPAHSINDLRLNLARVLCKQRKYEESIKYFEQCDLSVSVEHTCIYGLALFRANRPVDSFKVYQQTLEPLGESPALSQVHTALGMVAYILGDMSTAKSQLFDGFQTAQPSPYGLMALCALGLLQQDMTLASAVLEEFFKRDDRELLKDIALLQICKLCAQGEKVTAETQLRDMIEANPSKSALWSLLATLILTASPDRGAAAAESAHQALSLAQPHTAQKDRLIQTLGQLSAGHHSRHKNDVNALKSAERAFHANPGCTSAVSTLASAVHAEGLIRQALNKETGLFQFEKNLLNILLQSDISTDLQSWCLQQMIVNCIVESDIERAKSLLNQLQGHSPLSPDAEQFAAAILTFLSSQPAGASDMASQKLAMLVDCALYSQRQKFGEAVSSLRQSFELVGVNKNLSKLKYLQERTANTAYAGLQNQPENANLREHFEGAAKSLKDQEVPSSVVSLLQALVAFNDNKRLAKHHFATALDAIETDKELGYCSSIVRQALVTLLWDSKKESDQQLIKALLDNAKAEKDDMALQHYDKLSKQK